MKPLYGSCVHWIDMLGIDVFVTFHLRYLWTYPHCVYRKCNPTALFNYVPYRKHIFRLQFICIEMSILGDRVVTAHGKMAKTHAVTRQVEESDLSLVFDPSVIPPYSVRVTGLLEDAEDVWYLCILTVTSAPPFFLLLQNANKSNRQTSGRNVVSFTCLSLRWWVTDQQLNIRLILCALSHLPQIHVSIALIPIPLLLNPWHDRIHVIVGQMADYTDPHYSSWWG